MHQLICFKSHTIFCLHLTLFLSFSPPFLTFFPNFFSLRFLVTSFTYYYSTLLLIFTLSLLTYLIGAFHEAHFVGHSFHDKKNPFLSIAIHSYRSLSEGREKRNLFFFLREVLPSSLSSSLRQIGREVLKFETRDDQLSLASFFFPLSMFFSHSWSHSLTIHVPASLVWSLFFRYP